jgi:hypothetical protein
LYQAPRKALSVFFVPPPDLLLEDPVAGGATAACAPPGARRDPGIPSEALGAGFVPIQWRSCVVPAALLLGVVFSQRHRSVSNAQAECHQRAWARVLLRMG